jgi:hypothetical protein
VTGEWHGAPARMRLLHPAAPVPIIIYCSQRLISLQNIPGSAQNQIEAYGDGSDGLACGRSRWTFSGRMPLSFSWGKLGAGRLCIFTATRGIQSRTVTPSIRLCWLDFQTPPLFFLAPGECCSRDANRMSCIMLDLHNTNPKVDQMR